MPTATFENLPGEKRECIMQAAITEFAEHRFSDASINRIVKAAGISRGSFYQYFKDKEDLYLLIIERIGKEKMDVFANHSPPSPDATFFEAAIASIPAILEWVARCPQYNQIGMRMAQDESAFIQRIVQQMQGSQRSVLQYLQQDQQKGLVRQGVDLELVLQMTMTMVASLLREYYQEGCADAAVQRVKQMLTIIVNGIAEKGE